VTGNAFLSERATTLAQVARHALVSPATVSRVLNDDPRVGEDYRARVLSAVAELDYRPNRLARNLRKQRTATIGVVVPDIENPHFSEMVRSAEDTAFDRGYRVLVCNTDERSEKQSAYLEALLDERVAGVMISPSDPRGTQISALLDRRIPVVAFDREVADERADAVLADNVRATRTATQLLLDEGHERIAFVGGRRDVETGAERLAGYEMAMRAAALERVTLDGEFRLEAAQAAIERRLATGEPPTAVVVANNLMTVGVLRALRRAGLHVPQDVSLVGIDDPAWAELIDPPLTAMAQPVGRMAADAMMLLMERVRDGAGEPRRIVHSFELRRRASTRAR
jgi:DNA-binding LacI/PurR family transcriptional regulator